MLGRAKQNGQGCRYAIESAIHKQWARRVSTNQVACPNEHHHNIHRRFLACCRHRCCRRADALFRRQGSRRESSPIRCRKVAGTGQPGSNSSSPCSGRSAKHSNVKRLLALLLTERDTDKISLGLTAGSLFCWCLDFPTWVLLVTRSPSGFIGPPLHLRSERKSARGSSTIHQ